MMIELTFVTIVGTDGFKQVFVEVFPILEGKVLAENARRDVQCDECSFYKYGS